MHSRSKIWLYGREMDWRQVAVAKAIGWIFHEGSMNGSTSVTRPGGGYGTTEDIPDFLGDLNAMHEVEKTMTHEMLHEMNEQLCDVCPPNQRVWTASAEQKVESFLRAHQLWNPPKT